MRGKRAEKPSLRPAPPKFSRPPGEAVRLVNCGSSLYSAKITFQVSRCLPTDRSRRSGRLDGHLKRAVHIRLHFLPDEQQNLHQVASGLQVLGCACPLFAHFQRLGSNLHC